MVLFSFPLQGVAIIIGIMIGSGIFASPGVVLENCPDVGIYLLVWVVAGA
jgi:hypothetical protein